MFSGKFLKLFIKATNNYYGTSGQNLIANLDKSKRNVFLQTQGLEEN